MRPPDVIGAVPDRVFDRPAADALDALDAVLQQLAEGRDRLVSAWAKRLGGGEGAGREDERDKEGTS